MAEISEFVSISGWRSSADGLIFFFYFPFSKVQILANRVSCVSAVRRACFADSDRIAEIVPTAERIIETRSGEHEQPIVVDQFLSISMPHHDGIFG
ncbi:MAG: hypothetical protein R2788_14270 [Saprospiraceae bacterium]